jgi:aspartyl-tRNA(Asn)/glutamyl-tRNA(Gln) amidotransferase subunit A
LKVLKSQFNATAVQRVIDADAIIIGSQNCDEFGMGSTNENSAYGACLNAVGENRVAGGSSGGSAVAVQADMCLASWVQIQVVLYVCQQVFVVWWV